MLILDMFFLKYEGGRWEAGGVEEVKLTPPTFPEKTTLKKPSLIRVKDHL